MRAAMDEHQDEPLNNRRLRLFVRSTMLPTLLITAHAGLLIHLAFVNSPTDDEIAHLPSGILHWEFGRFDAHQVNPPLVRLVAAFPVWLMNPETDWSNFVTRRQKRPEWLIGRDFVAANGDRAFTCFTVARLACIPMSVFGGVICFLWARSLYGWSAGILALLLWCISPNILAHAPLVTADVGAAAAGVFAGYRIWMWLEDQSWSRAIVMGIAIGLAALTKLTWIILFVLLPVLWLTTYITRKHAAPASRQISQLLSSLILSLVIINSCYLWDGSFTRLRDFVFFSDTLSGRSDGVGLSDNRFAGTPLGSLPVPLPRDYLVGIDFQKRDFEKGRWSYLRGDFRHGGWWYYYVYAFIVKVPAGTIILGATLLVLSCCRSSYRVSVVEQAIVLLPGLAVFVLVSSQTGFNHHFRYVLPAFPFLFVWLSRIGICFTPGEFVKQRLFVVGLLTWMILSSLAVFPHSLSYFNELVGGPRRGHFHLLRSSVDLGQDLFRLKAWYEADKVRNSTKIAYFGPISPEAVGLKVRSPPTRIQVTNKSTKQVRPQSGWYAVSVNLLHGYPRMLMPSGSNHWSLMQQGAYSYFLDLEPFDRIGYSIHIYRVD